MKGGAELQVKVSDDELRRALRALGSKMGRKNLTRAGRRGAYIFLQEAKDNVPIEYGDLKSNLKLRQRVRWDEIEVSVGTSKEAAHAHLVELGTSPHVIKGKRKPGKKKQKHKPHRYVVNHPGSRPHPFLRPAFDRKKDEVLAKVLQMIRKYVLSSARGGTR